MPFDEEEKEKDVWFLDHEYLENMYTMFRKVNGKMKRFYLTARKKNSENVFFVVIDFQHANVSLVGITQVRNCTEMIFPSMN